MYIYFTWDAYRKAILAKQPKYYLRELLEDYTNFGDNSLIGKTKDQLINENLELLWELFTEDLSNI